MYKEFRGSADKINPEMKKWFEENQPVVFKQVIQTGVFRRGRDMVASLVINIWYKENIYTGRIE